MKRILSIEGMSCQHCVAHVKNALVELSGVESAEVDLATKKAVVTGTGLDDEAMKAAVAEAGYSVTSFS
jgi:copper chaperone